ncbi:hypothetical protein ACFYNZ_10640 [Streptomyces kebangsaanensis]|uniref:Uncharacterized protein n=1 Tax=Streptomyces kebangsaanensis TaxID=864058 RepID=A0ABW6KQ04_9ACTN
MRRPGCVVAATAAAVLAGLPGTAAADAARPVPEPDVAVVMYTGTGRTAAWHSGEAGFDRLRSVLDPAYTGTERVPEAWTEGRHPPVRITVLWGLTGVGGWPRTNRAPGGDVAMLRQDQLLVAEDGTPWVRTDPAPDLPDDDIRWHRASRRSYDRLDHDGLLGEEPAASGRDGTREKAWWAAAGLGAGVAGTLLVRRAAARHRAGPPRREARQELIDL